MNSPKKPIPHEGKGVNCGAKTRSGGRCAHPAGWSTDHPGQGKCKLHGGASRVKHGLYSKIKRASLRAHLEQIENDQIGLDLTREVNLLRALIADLLANKLATDPGVIAMLVDKVGATADRIQKHQQAKSVSLATLNRVMEQMGVEVAAPVQEAKLDPATGTTVCEIIERRWASIRLDAYSTSDSRAQTPA
jgi:hypothetical protein